jgi:predicted HicB family RNase H-like nuclease
MTISKDNTRTLITLPKDLKAKLERMAEQDERSFNNLVLKVLKDYAQNTK